MIFDYVELSSVAAVFNGKTPSKAEQRDEGFPVLKIRDVDDEFLFRGEFQSFIDKKFYDQYEEKRISLYDSLILNAAHNASYVGSKQYCAEKAVVGSIATGEWLVCRANKVLLDERYLSFWLRSESTRFQMSGLVKGIHLYPKDVARLKIPLPPLSVQKQIAAILEKADQLRKDCQQMEQELNNLAQAVFIDMFGDPVSNPKEWPKVALAEMVESKDDIKCGPFGTQLAKSEFKLTGVPLWGIKNVNNGFRVAPHEFVSLEKAKNLHTYSIEAGDIVMTRKGNVGNCHIYPAHLEDGIMHSDLLRIRPSKSKVDSAFLQKQLIYSRDVEDQLRLISQGAIMAGINVTKLKSLTLIYPPIDLQKKFSNIISSIDAQLSALAIVQQDHQENFNSLMQKAFNGELKLKPKAA